MNREEICRILTELGFDMKIKYQTFKKGNFTVLVSFNSYAFSISLYKELGENNNIDIKFMDTLEDFENKVKHYLIRLQTGMFYLE